MVELNYTQIILAIIGVLASASGITAIFTIPYIRRKASAEATSKIQDVYQETIEDLRKDKEILKAEKAELQKDKSELKREIEELRQIVWQNTKDIAQLKDLACLKEKCKTRIKAQQ
jgi:predicted nucleotidyltransferase